MIPVERRFPSDAAGDVKAALAATPAALPKRPDGVALNRERPD